MDLVSLLKLNNPFGDDKRHAACAIFGMMNVSGELMPGEQVFAAMNNMHERGNGLGAGFAVYGLYPHMRDYYALHVMFTDVRGKTAAEELLRKSFVLEGSEPIPTRKTPGISAEPLLWRYFLAPLDTSLGEDGEQDLLMDMVLRLNTEVPDTFVFSCGKNMGVFKGVGYPDQIAHFYRLEDYSGYIWTAHSRFPTNSHAWWGGAHPFCLVDWSVVHNGEISSYGTNRAFLETLGYRCTLFTDTEVMAYAVDLLMRRQKMTPELFAKVVAPPFWEEIDAMAEPERTLHTALRVTYAGLLMNGPFAVVIANGEQMIALTDRIRLRPLTVAVRGDIFYVSSEEAAIRFVCPGVDAVWTPKGGVPVVGRLGLIPKPEHASDNVGVCVTACGGYRDAAQS
ncbi:MAG: glutamine amidotransferase family protein [Armatimonadota bacterium]|nr:glutamine amidotransferase family protein [Armatimonadota bacterium]